MLMVFTAIFPVAGNTTTNKNLNTEEMKETYVGSEEDWWRMRSHDSQRTGFSNSFECRSAATSVLSSSPDSSG